MNDLENGIVIKLNGDPYLVLSVSHLHMGRGAASVQTRLRNLRTSQVLERNFKPSDEFEEVEIIKMPVRFLYFNRGQYCFVQNDNPRNRFFLDAETIGDVGQFLKPDLEVIAIKYEDKIINIELPIKVDYKVIETPPNVRGNTVQGGTKVAILETGTKVNVPLFINEGDIIRVNTVTREYTERVFKSS
jgi:elongation factor P